MKSLINIKIKNNTILFLFKVKISDIMKFKAIIFGVIRNERPKYYHS